MANEITISLNLAVNKDGMKAEGTVVEALDMSGAELIGASQSLTTSTAQINIGGCDQIKAILIRNTSATETVNVGLNTPITQLISAIPPRKGILLLSPPSTLYAATVANTADIWVAACEN